MKFSLCYLIYLFLVGQLWSQVQVSMPIRNLAVYETGQVHVSSLGQPLTECPRRIQGNGFELELFEASQILSDDRKVVHVYSFSFTPSRSGDFMTPFIEVGAQGKKFTLSPLPFKVHPLESFDKREFKLGRKKFSYYSKTFLSKRNAFVNEAIAVEARYLVPLRSGLNQWGVSSTPNTTHLFAGELDIPEHHGGRVGYDLTTSRKVIDGTTYIGAAYHTLIFGESPGTDTYGPISVSCVFPVSRLTQLGLHRRENIRENLITEASSISILPLPPGEPAGFDGNVGEYEINTKFPERLEVKEGSSLKITTSINGTGNFTMLNQPKIKDTENWKIVDVTKEVIGSGLPSLNKGASFTFLVSPKRPVSQTPEFHLQAFNPRTLRYETIQSEVLPVQFLRAAEPQTLSSPPIENQQELLGFITPDRLQHQTSSFAIGRYWHLLPLAVVVAMLFTWGFGHFRRYRLTHAEHFQRRRELNQLASQEHTEQDFFRAVGKFIERWHGENNKPELQELLEERDNRCFVPESKKLEKSLTSETKNSIIKLLKSLTLLFVFLSLTPELEAANDPAAEAIEAGNLDKALRLYQQIDNPSSDVLYNIGICYYKKGALGYAALYFHRACLKEPDHHEAQQNLKILATLLLHPVYNQERKSDKWVTLLEKSSYLIMFQISLWLFGILILALIVFRLKPRMKLAVLMCLSLAFCLAISSQVLLQLYPKSIYFAPLSQLSVVVEANQKLQTEPASLTNEDSEKQIVDLPEASLCRVIAERASWAYVELPSQTRGWVKRDGIMKIQKPDPSPLESPLP